MSIWDPYRLRLHAVCSTQPHNQSSVPTFLWNERFYRSEERETQLTTLSFHSSGSRFRPTFSGFPAREELVPCVRRETTFEVSTELYPALLGAVTGFPFVTKIRLRPLRTLYRRWTPTMRSGLGFYSVGLCGLVFAVDGVWHVSSSASGKSDRSFPIRGSENLLLVSTLRYRYQKGLLVIKTESLWEF